MAYPIFATSQVLQLGPSNQFFVAGIQDANGNIATATTNYKLRPSGLLLPEQVDANGIPLATSRITTLLTSTPLAAAGTSTQAWQDSTALACNFVSGSVYADQAGTLYVDFSDDGTNLYGTSATTLAFTPTTGGTANGQTLPYPVEIPTRYFRFRYVNGSTAQGTFQLRQTPVSDWSPRQVELTGQNVPYADGTLPWNTAPTVSAAASEILLTATDISLAASANYSTSIIASPNSQNISLGVIVSAGGLANEGLVWSDVLSGDHQWSQNFSSGSDAINSTGVIAPYVQGAVTNGSTAQTLFDLQLFSAGGI